jgi:hypothetical protein
MARQILDADLQEWEVFVNPARGGYATPRRIVFRCLSDPLVQSRAADYDASVREMDAAVFLHEADDEALLEMLAGAEPLS